MVKNTSKKFAPVVVVLGATGQQGGAVARALVADGRWHVRAIARDPASAASTELSDLGVEVVSGNLNRPESLQSAFAGAHGVFSVQATDRGQEVEVRQGIAAVDTAVASGVAHFVYASVGGADRRSGVPHFESKWAVEQHLARSGLRHTVVRPAFFMENFTRLPMRILLMALTRRYLPEDKPLQMISVRDVGNWVATTFAEPERYADKAQEIAGDELTRAQIAAAFKTSRWFAGLPVPGMLLRRLPDDVLKMFEWFAKDGYHADIQTLRKSQPGLLTFGQWLDRQGT